jgi:F420-non-reducing hydrogenase large subunit
VTAVAGGISFNLSDGQFQRLRELTAEAVALAIELSGPLKTLLLRLFDKNPWLLSGLNVPSWYVGTIEAEGVLNLYDGRIRVMDETGGVRTEFAADQYIDFMAERAVSNSYAKEVYIDLDGSEHMYRVGTLARLNVVEGFTTPLAQVEFEEFRTKFGRPCHNAVVQMYAKLIELVYACERAEQLINNPALRGENRVPVQFKGGRGVAHIEAPRGTLIHDYEIDEKGIVRAANMIIATQQNTAVINKSLKEGANALLEGTGDEKMLNALEFVVRCYDPCLACSTHAIGSMALAVEVRQQGRVVRQLRRN